MNLHTERQLLKNKQRHSGTGRMTDQMNGATGIISLIIKNALSDLVRLLSVAAVSRQVQRIPATKAAPVVDFHRHVTAGDV